MVCKACGTTIAEKAIVCYRCGTPTSAPVASANRRVDGPRPWSLARIVALVLPGVFVIAAVVTPAGSSARSWLWVGLGASVVAAAVVAWSRRAR